MPRLYVCCADTSVIMTGLLCVYISHLSMSLISYFVLIGLNHLGDGHLMKYG